jgi:hypothetical protein
VFGAAITAVLDNYPQNFRKPGSDPCKLGTFSIKLKAALSLKITRRALCAYLAAQTRS